jgi:hypothetical protein
MKTLKFNEYNALREQLEKEGKSINEFVEETTGQPLNEAGEDPIDATGKESDPHATIPLLFWVKSPKGALAMRGLNKEAKKAKRIIEDNIIEKFYPKILANQKELLNQTELLVKKMKEGGDKERIKASLGDLIQQGQNVQAEQLKNINSAMGKIMDNFDTKINSYIAKKDLPDRRKLTIENAWIMLSTQVRQAMWNLMQQKSKEFFQSIVKDNEDMVTFEDKITGTSFFDKLKEDEKKKEDGAKEVIKKDKVEDTGDADAEASGDTGAAGEKDSEASGDTGVAGEKKDGEDVAGEKSKPKEGEIWTWRGTVKKEDGTKMGKHLTAKIVKIGTAENEIKEGETQVMMVEKKKNDKGKWNWAAKNTGVGKFQSIANSVIEKGKKKDDASPDDKWEKEMPKYKAGTKWNYKTPKGVEKVVEIMKPTKEDTAAKQIRVKNPGKKGAGWPVNRTGLILDKYEKKDMPFGMDK